MLEVIGAGLGRTGTHSLAEALEILGFSPCYTIQSVDQNPEHQDLWEQAMEGVAVNWASLYQKYRSAVEWPTVAFLTSIIESFPNAKVILTIREPESWFDSATQTIFPALEASALNPNPEQRTSASFKRRLILEEVFQGRYWEKEFALALYRDHNQSVVNLVPEHRLLLYRIQEGWPKLCQFLELPEPDKPFPWRNRKSEFLNSAPDWAVEWLEQAINKQRSGKN